jgi:broad specificity phosphatase PhoE
VAVVLDELDEFDAFGLVRQGALLTELAALAEREPRGQALFEAIVGRWMRGELTAEGIEPYAEFEARVRRGLDRIIAAEGRGRHVAVVTSGGPISIALKASLGVGDEKVLAMQGVLNNASVTELMYRSRGADALTLARFNSVAHLERDLLTRV